MIEWYFFIPGLLALITAFALSVLSVLGSNIMAFAVLAFYNYYFYGGYISIWIIIFLFLLALFSEWVDFFSGPIGSKFGGADKKAVRLAVIVLMISTVISLVTFQFYIMIFSFFIALIAGEIYYNKNWTVWGILKSVISVCLVKGTALIIKISLSFVMLLYYVYVYIKL